jgi:hypothetical protein
MSGVSTATVLAGASLAATVGGTVLGAIGQSNAAYSTAGQTAAAANYQAQVARMNQQVMENNATLAEQRGEADAQRKELEVAQTEGSQRAALAAQGGDVNAGSNLDILGDTARAGYTDVATIRSNAAYEAYGYRVQGAGLGATANLDTMAAGNAYSSLANLPYGIGSSLLGGASSVSDKYLTYSNRGLFGDSSTPAPKVGSGLGETY